MKTLISKSVMYGCKKRFNIDNLTYWNHLATNKQENNNRIRKSNGQKKKKDKWLETSQMSNKNQAVVTQIIFSIILYILFMIVSLILWHKHNEFNSSITRQKTMRIFTNKQTWWPKGPKSLESLLSFNILIWRIMEDDNKIKGFRGI